MNANFSSSTAKEIDGSSLETLSPDRDFMHDFVLVPITIQPLVRPDLEQTGTVWSEARTF